MEDMPSSFRIKGAQSKAFISYKRILQLSVRRMIQYKPMTQKPTSFLNGLVSDFLPNNKDSSRYIVSTEVNQEKQTITNIFELQSIQY